MNESERPVFTLRQIIDPKYLSKRQIRTEKVPPVLSNLLPEGILRELTAKSLNCHPNNEFSMLAYLGSNLPGAIIATPIKAGNLPHWALELRLATEPQQIEVKHADTKFSSSHLDGCYHIDKELTGDMWIIKTWAAIKPHLLDTIKIARDIWPEMLAVLPMFDEHKQALMLHWRKLQPEFRIIAV